MPPANSTNSAKTRLNPPALVHRVTEVVPVLPVRILPNDDRAAAILKKRTLTNLYNEQPTWLRNAHARLNSGFCVVGHLRWHKKQTWTKMTAVSASAR